MSMSGARQLELERARREALRLEQVRGECRALLHVCEQQMACVREPVMQQYAAAGLRALVTELREVKGLLEATPDAALERLQDAQRRLGSALAEAEARARGWTDAQARARSQVAVLAGRIEALEASQKESSERGLAEARRWVDQARTHAERGAEGEAAHCVEQASHALAGARKAGFEERVRKETVRSLLRTLQDLGFIIVQGPSLEADVVTLEGRLPSGRRARFEVKVDGQMAFDLDGYEGRSCAQEMEKVEVAMRDRFGVLLGPPQVVWKNPDRLSRGARELPDGGQARRAR